MYYSSVSKFLVFLFISIGLHLVLLLGLGGVELTQSLKSSSYSKELGKSSIKARLIVQQKVKKLPKTGKKKAPMPPKKEPNQGQARVEDRSKSRTDSGSEEMLSRYLSEIRELILKNKYKTLVASRLNLRGTSKISFKISEPNTLSELKVLKSSGKRLLDESALETVRRVGVVPEIPEKLGLKEISIVLEMEFE